MMVGDFPHVANSAKLMGASRSGICWRTDTCSIKLILRLVNMKIASILSVYSHVYFDDRGESLISRMRSPT